LRFDQFQLYSDSAELPKRIDVRQVQCLDCFALYMSPCYSEYGFRVLFAEAGCSYGSSAGRPLEQCEWLGARGLLRSGSRLLDAGCYEGTFLAKLPEDVRKIGVDIDAPAIERGRRQFADKSIDFILGDFETFHCDESLDTITMFHVLEHLPRPKAALQNLRSMAHEGTRLVVEVPILENGITNDINGFFSAHHMTHFTRASLEICLGLAGWQIIEAKEQEDYNGFRIVAAPAESTRAAGRASSTTLLLHAYLSGWHAALRAVECRICAWESEARVLIWGGGLHTEFLYQVSSFFASQPNREYAIVDSDPIKQGKSWRGIQIYHPDILRSTSWADECLLVSSYGSTPAIVAAALELGVPRERILTLYDEVRVH
jgi:2-polyprenyl-3-methyl-5-hydroxy-6-metoxy-1,4-benzoquinol methylase